MKITDDPQADTLYIELRHVQALRALFRVFGLKVFFASGLVQALIGGKKDERRRIRWEIVAQSQGAGKLKGIEGA